MCFAVLVLVIGDEGSQFAYFGVDLLVDLLHPDPGEGVEKLVEVQFAGADVLVAEAVDLVIAIGEVVMSNWHFDYNWVPHRAPVRVENLEVNISSVVGWNFARPTDMTLKKWPVGADGELLGKGVLEDTLTDSVEQILADILILIHDRVLAGPRNTIVMR